MSISRTLRTSGSSRMTRVSGPLTSVRAGGGVVVADLTSEGSLVRSQLRPPGRLHISGCPCSRLALTFSLPGPASAVSGPGLILGCWSWPCAYMLTRAGWVVGGAAGAGRAGGWPPGGIAGRWGGCAGWGGRVGRGACGAGGVGLHRVRGVRAADRPHGGGAHDAVVAVGVVGGDPAERVPGELAGLGVVRGDLLGGGVAGQRLKFQQRLGRGRAVQAAVGDDRAFVGALGSAV